MSEALLLKAILNRLAYIRGTHALRLNSGMAILGTGARKLAIKGCEPGTPDVMVMLPGGSVVWIEVKTPTGRVSKTQKAWHARAGKMGHTVHVVRSVQEAVDAVEAAMEVRE